MLQKPLLAQRLSIAAAGGSGNSFGMNVSGEAAHPGFREGPRAGARHVAVRAAVAEPDERAAAVGVVPLAAAVVLDAPVEAWAEPPAVVAGPAERAETLAGSRRVWVAGRGPCALAVAVPVGVTALRVAALNDS